MKRFKSIVLTVAVLLMAACNQVTDLPVDGEITVGFDYTLTGIHSQRIVSQGTRAPENVRAEMAITSHKTGTTTTVPWYLTVDEEARTVVSNMTRVLEEGYYDFALTLIMGNHTYVGSAQNVNVNNDSSVALTITPVIGDTTVNVNVTELPKLKLSYPVSELTDIADPQIGYSIDGANEVLISLDKNTGFNAKYISLSEGNHTLELKLYNGSLQIGESRNEQESITIIPGEDVKMDIIPLYAAMSTEITMDGGQAVFNLTIPKVVIDEAGGVNNLTTIFQLTGKNNPYVERNLTLTQTGDVYNASVTLDSYHYDDVVIMLEFLDGSESLGKASTGEIALKNTDQQINLNVELNRRAVISGNLLSVIGVNVYDELDNPVAGATVKANGKVVGITGSGAFGTPGYVSFFQTAGDVALTAEKEAAIGETTVTVSPLEITNCVIALDSASVRVVKVAGGYDQTMILKSDGFLWGMGRNDYGQLGLGTTAHITSAPAEITGNVIDISAKHLHALILKKDDTLWATGYNRYGQLGDGSNTDRIVPVQVLDNVVKISTGFYHSLALKHDGTLWVSGNNGYGQLGDGTTADKNSFIQIKTGVIDIASGGYTSYFITQDNTLWGVGHNTNGELADGTNEHKYAPIEITRDVTTIISGYHHFFIEKTDGSIMGAGYGFHGQFALGYPENQLNLINISGDIKSFYAGGSTTYILRRDNSLWGCGRNDFGQIGSGNTEDQHSWVKISDDVEQVYPGRHHTVFTKTNNTLWGMGLNSSNQLVPGNTTKQLIPVQVFQ